MFVKPLIKKISSNDSILRKEIRKRDRLRKKYILLKNDSSKEMYKRERNLVNNKKKQAQNQGDLSHHLLLNLL
jgi:hypothetical protein